MCVCAFPICKFVLFVGNLRVCEHENVCGSVEVGVCFRSLEDAGFGILLWPASSASQAVLMIAKHFPYSPLTASLLILTPQVSPVKSLSSPCLPGTAWEFALPLKLDSRCYLSKRPLNL